MKLINHIKFKEFLDKGLPYKLYTREFHRWLATGYGILEAYPLDPYIVIDSGERFNLVGDNLIEVPELDIIKEEFKIDESVLQEATIALFHITGFNWISYYQDGIPSSVKITTERNAEVMDMGAITDLVILLKGEFPACRGYSTEPLRKNYAMLLYTTYHLLKNQKDEKNENNQ